jgi:hypothetical protein
MDKPPLEVIEASQRLAEKKPTQSIPTVFKDIMANDSERAAIREKGADMTQADWRRLASLNHDKKTNLRPGAEKALRWNTDKGKPE